MKQENIRNKLLISKWWDLEDKILKMRKIYYESNKNKIAEQGKIYRNDNKNKIAERKKKYREQNSEKIKVQKSALKICDICNKQITSSHLARHKRIHVD